MAALHGKYAAEEPPAAAAAARPIVISGKVAEERGFDAIRRRLAQVERLKVVILDGLRVADAVRPSERPVAETCPSIVQLDLSRNLFETVRPVVDICAELGSLTNLSLKYAPLPGHAPPSGPRAAPPVLTLTTSPPPQWEPFLGRLGR